MYRTQPAIALYENNNHTLQKSFTVEEHYYGKLDVRNALDDESDIMQVSCDNK